MNTRENMKVFVCRCLPLAHSHFHLHTCGIGGAQVLGHRADLAVTQFWGFEFCIYCWDSYFIISQSFIGLVMATLGLCFLWLFFSFFFLRSRRNLEFDLYMCEVLLYSFFLCFHLSSSVVNMTKFPQLGWFSGTILLIIFILIMQCLERVSERGKAYNNRRRNETLMALGIWKGVVASCTPWICAGITAVVKAPFFSSDKRILCLPFLHQLQ